MSITNSHKKNNEVFYNLLSAFKNLTGIPMLLNTSFNENEPIVNSPDDAINCFVRTDMDALIIENIMIKKSIMISVLKLKSGNIASVANMFKFLGNDVEVITTRSQLLKAKIVMPGIGSFDETMNYLQENNLVSILKELIIKHEIPTLGICLGMQIFVLHLRKDY